MYLHQLRTDDLHAVAISAVDTLKGRAQRPGEQAPALGRGDAGAERRTSGRSSYASGSSARSSTRNDLRTIGTHAEERHRQRAGEQRQRERRAELARGERETEHERGEAELLAGDGSELRSRAAALSIWRAVMSSGFVPGTSAASGVRATRVRGFPDPRRACLAPMAPH